MTSMVASWQLSSRRASKRPCNSRSAKARLIDSPGPTRRWQRRPSSAAVWDQHRPLLLAQTGRCPPPTTSPRQGARTITASSPPRSNCMLQAVPRKALSISPCRLTTLCQTPKSENITNAKYRTLTAATRPNASGTSKRVRIRLLARRSSCEPTLLPASQTAALIVRPL